MTKKEIEEKELHYLKQFTYNLNLEKDKMLCGILSKEEIRNNWKGIQKPGISEVSRGVERIFYWLFNQLGKPNSCPVSSDLFFETYDAFIHIDIKTIQTDNMGDFIGNIFVGDNQNSYNGKFEVNKGKEDKRIEEYKGKLPPFYTKIKNDKKICKKITLTYFITTLIDNETGEIALIYITCMPNGDLKYENILAAGKNLGKIRFKHLKTKFENLDKQPRTNVIHLNDVYIEQKKLNKKLKKYIDFYYKKNTNLKNPKGKIICIENKVLETVHPDYKLKQKQTDLQTLSDCKSKPKK